MVAADTNTQQGEAIESVEKDASVGSDSLKNICALWYLLLSRHPPSCAMVHPRTRTPVFMPVTHFRLCVLTQNYIVKRKIT